MPDVLITVPDVTVMGRWAGRDVRGVARLILHADGIELDNAEIAWRSLSDATLTREQLVLYRTPDALVLHGSTELPRVWAMIVEHACPVPEVTRGLRSLRPQAGPAAEWQTRFLGPLLAARRRVEEPDAPERRVTQLNAAEMADRLQLSIQQWAAQRHPDSPPRRRALEAHLEEGAEGLIARLAELDSAAEALLGAADGSRFLAWRGWTHRLRRVFLEADRAWHAMAPHLTSG